ncbi:MAG: ParB/RepB/Spo0J family partition protein [Verrucomicrobiae bacterium]|nr:ParB/RepB/Spo0J family partition protein [Verrucomicrobiae bacterium]
MPKSADRRSKPAPRPPPGLGRGLAEIIAQGTGAAAPASVAASASAQEGVRHLPLAKIIPNPRQPRTRFDETPLDDLVASIREHGVMQPVTVRPRGDAFELIAGERRFRASQKAGLQSLPALVRDVSDQEAYMLALIENLQREDLNPIEEARGYRRLADDFSLTQEMISQKVGKSRATVANALRLLELSEEVRSWVAQGRLSSGHAKAILGLEGGEKQLHAAREVVRQGWNVRQTEAFVARLLDRNGGTPRKRKTPQGATPAHWQALQDALQQKLGTRVHLRAAGKGGRIEIEFFEAGDLDRLLQALGVQL